MFNFNGKYTKAINKQILQAKRASYSLIAKARKFQLPVDMQLHLFDTCILPILLYGCEVWGFSKLQNIEIFHNQFCKFLLKIGPKSINNITLGELGRFKVEKFVKQRMLNFWVKINTSKDSKVSMAMYQKVREMYDKGEYESEWVKCIKSTLDQLQLGHLWDTDPTSMKPNALKTEFDKKLQLFYGQHWFTETENSSACHTYNIFKNIFRLEPYLLSLEPKYAIPICKFRTNNHRLPIVVGRYNNINKADRKCELCREDVIGDEYHYLLKCRFFNSQRDLYIHPRYTECANTLKMKHLLNSTDTTELIKLSKFINSILNHFKNVSVKPTFSPACVSTNYILLINVIM